MSSNPVERGRSPKRIWLRLSLGFLVVVLLLAGGLWVAGAVARSRLARAYPAPGQLVDVGGYRLHLYCLGEGSPTVVLEAGLNDFSVQWTQVQTEIAKFARVCSYDRAGLGWSDRGGLPRSGTAMVLELQKLIENAGIQGPLVLVGHSFGGLLAREYAQAHSGRVVGLVLVDAAHEDYLERVPQLRPIIAQSAQQFESLALMKRLGLVALSPARIPARGLTGDALARYRAVLATTDYFETAAAETAALAANVAEARALPLPTLDELPLIVLRRGQADPLPGLSAADNQRYEQEWSALQVRLAALSRRSRMGTAKRSGHDIHLTQPELVVAAILNVIAASW